MTNNPFSEGLSQIACVVIDSIIKDMNELNIEDETRKIIIDHLEAKKKDEKLGAKKKRPNNRRVLLDKNQCERINEEGKRCGAPMCDRDLKRCWVHLTKVQQAAYRWKKANKKDDI
jgi:hypothetical protein